MLSWYITLLCDRVGGYVGMEKGAQAKATIGRGCTQWLGCGQAEYIHSAGVKN